MLKIALKNNKATKPVRRSGILAVALLCCTGLHEAAFAQQNVAANPTVWIEVPNTQPFAGERIDLSLHIGTDDLPVDNLFGLGFELRYSDGAYLQFANPSDAIAGEFLQPNVYTFTRHEPENRVFYLAVSRKRGAGGQDGAGISLVLPLSISADAVPGWQACFAISNVIANDPDGNPIAIAAGPAVCVQVSEPRVDVLPNPITPNDDGYNDQVEFRRDGGIPSDWTITIMERTGEIIRLLADGKRFWDGRDEAGKMMLPGVYLYVIRDGERVVKQGVLGIIR